MISNLLILAGAGVASVCLGELTHSIWWPGMTIVAPVLAFVGYVNAPTEGGPASAEVRKPR